MFFIKRLLSFIYPVVVENTFSKYNDHLEVRLENGRFVLNSANANYSFGSLHRIFREAFRRTNTGSREIKTVLLLGLGSGSVPFLLFNELKINCSITAVEIDETVIALARKYFDIERLEQLEIVCADAFEFVKHVDNKFDLIIADLFIDNTVPQQFFSEPFLTKLKQAMNQNSLLLFNTILKTQTDVDAARRIFADHFQKTTVLRIENNVVYAMQT